VSLKFFGISGRLTDLRKCFDPLEVETRFRRVRSPRTIGRNDRVAI
jgi:hypothetical protein